MKLKRDINKLWQQLEDTIELVCKATDDDNTRALYDYRPNSGHGDLQKLVLAETVNEKRHRRGAPAGFTAPISCETAAKLLLMQNMADGAFKTEIPSAITFLIFRQSAAEATLLGFLLRHGLTGEWCKAVREFDYADIMRAR